MEDTSNKQQATSNKKNFIATLELFPDRVSTSIRQKTRWTIGIAFQGARALGWYGSLSDRYFLWRDRRGPLNAILLLASLLLSCVCFGHYIFFGSFPKIIQQPIFAEILLINFILMGWRLFVRGFISANIYGFLFVVLMPLRWMLANFINTMSAYKAFVSYQESVRSGKDPTWVKTQHRLPVGFGISDDSSGPVREMR